MYNVGQYRPWLFPKTIYEQIDPLLPFYLTDRLEDLRFRELPTKPRDFIQAEPFVGSRKRSGGVGLRFFGESSCIWVVVAGGMSEDEVYERTDAYPGATKDYDHVGSVNLEGSG